MKEFALHPKLDADTIDVATLDLSVVRLMNDRRFPWVILVPQRADAVEIVDLEPEDRATLIEEIALVSSALKDVFNARKLNVAAIGNLVPQTPRPRRGALRER